ncbi:MAG TPA: FtsW/RodA/SpoVE family cell cycle protein, partial [Acidimicrobiales bacterium]|nr:FtsW/RodA/SpoVE family cell cycle protein [Acidimicrobiales bacterium]
MMQAPRNPAAPWRHVDVTLLLSTLGISFIGVLMVYSATRQKQETAGLDPAFFLKRQAIYLLVGLVAMAVVALVDYRHIRDFVPILYGFAGVVSDPSGTAFGAFSGFPLAQFPVAGKTGTAEVNGKQDTSLFTAYAPANAP